jgi:hypothetical protein
MYGEIVPLDWIPGTEGREAQVRRVPLGPIVGISPFNFPLNLVAHKVAPALAAGNPIIIRPASQTPVSALGSAEVIAESGGQKARSVLCPAPRTMPRHSFGRSDSHVDLHRQSGSGVVVEKPGWAQARHAGAGRQRRCHRAS